jgi:hypothetical protein
MPSVMLRVLMLPRRFALGVRWRISHKLRVHDYKVGIDLYPPKADPASGQIREVFDLLAGTWPRWLRRMHQYVKRVQVGAMPARVAAFYPEVRQVDLDRHHLCSESVESGAATVVHIFTRARFASAGLVAGRRHLPRIQQACLAQQIAFLECLPESPRRADLLATAVANWEHAEAIFGVDAQDEAYRQEAARLGLPTGLIDWSVRKIRRRDHAVVSPLREIAVPMGDHRIKRILRRYPKSSEFADAEFELSGIPLADLQAAFERAPTDPLYAPLEVGDTPSRFFEERLGIAFDRVLFDYFLHVYVRKEHEKEVFGDRGKGFLGFPPPESGPPANIDPLINWISARPKDGREQYLPDAANREWHEP